MAQHTQYVIAVGELRRCYDRHLPDVIATLKEDRSWLESATTHAKTASNGDIFDNLSKKYTSAISKIQDLETKTVRSLEDAIDGLESVVNRQIAMEDGLSGSLRTYLTDEYPGEY